MSGTGSGQPLDGSIASPTNDACLAFFNRERDIAGLEVVTSYGGSGFPGESSRINNTWSLPIIIPS